MSLNFIADPDPKCPKCGGYTRIDVLRIGRWVCMTCPHSWVEIPGDETTRAPREQDEE